MTNDERRSPLIVRVIGVGDTTGMEMESAAVEIDTARR